VPELHHDDEAEPLPRLTMTMQEAAQLIGISVSAAYDAAARGEIPTVRIGRRVLVKREQLVGLLLSS
jgi:excisionase family DNA binding protein